jgi:hypothetical protein
MIVDAKIFYRLRVMDGDAIKIKDSNEKNFSTSRML